MNKVKVLMGAIIIVVIVSISIFTTTQNYQDNTQRAILDNPESNDMVVVSLYPDTDSPKLNDSYSQQVQNFWTDENSNRHYSITAMDSPTIED